MSDPVSVSGPDIETLLAAHPGWLTTHNDDDVLCVECYGGCGETIPVPKGRSPGATYRAHVAAVLRAHIVTAQADAWQVGRMVGQYEINSGQMNGTPNPYRAGARVTDLRPESLSLDHEPNAWGYGVEVVRGAEDGVCQQDHRPIGQVLPAPGPHTRQIECQIVGTANLKPIHNHPYLQVRRGGPRGDRTHNPRIKSPLLVH